VFAIAVTTTIAVSSTITVTATNAVITVITTIAFINVIVVPWGILLLPPSSGIPKHHHERPRRLQPVHDVPPICIHQVMQSLQAMDTSIHAPVGVMKRFRSICPHGKMSRVLVHLEFLP
jgi:hypothetical protein